MQDVIGGIEFVVLLAAVTPVDKATLVKVNYSDEVALIKFDILVLFEGAGRLPVTTDL